VTLHLSQKIKTHVDTTITTDKIYDRLVENHNSCCGSRHVFYF